MAEYADATRSHSSALRNAPDWIIKKVEREEKRADDARRRKANMKSCSVSMQHKELELQLAEATLK